MLFPAHHAFPHNNQESYACKFTLTINLILVETLQIGHMPCTSTVLYCM